MIKNYYLLLLTLFISCNSKYSGKTTLGTHQYDVIIYGASSSGVAAAIAAARNDANVLLISETTHIGGLSSSGLTATDMNSCEHIGGISKEFYQNIYTEYLNSNRWKYENRDDFFSRSKHRTYSGKNDKLKMQWVFESKIARKVFVEMIDNEDIELLVNSRIKNIKISNRKITKIVLDSTKELTAEFFIDATYSGDLMSMSGVSYTTTRESKKTYNETYAGFGHFRKYPSFSSDTTSIDPFLIEGQKESGLLPYIKQFQKKRNGESDAGIQAYCYRLTLTDHLPNKIPIAKPEGYDSTLYEYILRAIRKDSSSISLKNIFTTTPMPNKKTDTNGIDFVGGNSEWHNSEYVVREKVEEKHKLFTLGFIWFIQNDPRVPQIISDAAKKWGLAKDEFITTDNFPPQLYIRESRRMVSNYIMTEHNCFMTKIAPKSIGFGTYSADSHVVQRFINQSNEVIEEGHFYQPTGNYKISYESIIPQKKECTNLFVPVCLSASHVAYGSIRMEPVFMVLGHSAGTAAAICAKYNILSQDLDYSFLRQQLKKEKQLL